MQYPLQRVHHHVKFIRYCLFIEYSRPIIFFTLSLIYNNDRSMTDTIAFKSSITRSTMLISGRHEYGSIHSHQARLKCSSIQRHQAMDFLASFTKKGVLILLWICLMQESLNGISFIF